MRSDVKIGLGVGALLLVIVVGYLASHSSDNKGEKIDTTVATNSNPNSTSTDTTPAPAAAEKPPIAQSNSAAESKPVDTTPAPTSPAGSSNTSVSISGPATAPSNPVAIAPTTAPSAIPAAEPIASAAHPAPATPDWNKLLDGQANAGGDSSAGASTGAGSQAGTSTSNLYASGASTPIDTGTGTLTSSTSGRASRHGIPTTAPSGDVAGKHVVRSGETLSLIAAAAYGSSNYWPAIARANPGINPNAMHVGQVINLPEVSAVKVTSAAPDRSPPPSGSTLVVDPTKEYSVQQGDSLYTISQKLYGTPSKVEQIYQLNKATIGPSMSRLKVHMVLKLPTAPSTRPA